MSQKCTEINTLSNKRFLKNIDISMYKTKTRCLPNILQNSDEK